MIRALTRSELQAATPADRTVALVPTMGALHEGHLSLLDRAREVADFVILSVFVNPLQFGPQEDLARYPRNLERDAELADGRGAHLLFAPSLEQVYPTGEPIVRVAPGRLGESLCGAFRPGHFEGVLTVVAKLFHVCRPHIGIFGQKDFQQTVLVRRMATDLDFPVRIEVAPIVRDADGLALSSRNEYLSPAERAAAPVLYRALVRGREEFQTGTREAPAILAAARSVLAEEPAVQVQYLELVHPDTLDPDAVARRGAVLAVAAHLGRTRLIDNIVL